MGDARRGLTLDISDPILLRAMRGQSVSVGPALGWALIGALPAALAVWLATGTWTIVAAAGAMIGTTGLVTAGMRTERKLADAADRERQLSSAAGSAESRIAALEAKLRESSSHDDVTGTLNRRAFLTRLDEVLRRDARLRKPMAFLLVDVEGFRKINAEAGRMVGDRVLRQVGKAILASTRGTDFVGRIGGDEFAIVLGECTDPRPAADRIFVALHGESIGDEHVGPVHASIGIVTMTEAQADVDLAHLFRLAEDALAPVRGTGQSRCGRRDYQTEAPRPAVVR
jgi:diguanylate cyclase (GGDEF)-like protein